MPSKFGKYRSRRKVSAKPKKTKPKGGGILGDIGKGVDAVGKFVQDSGKAVAGVAADAAPLLGKAVSFVGSKIKDKAGVGKAMQAVGDFTADSGAAIAKEVGKAAPVIGQATSWMGREMKRADPDYGGGLLSNLKFAHGKHASHVVGNLDDDQYQTVQSAARYIAGHPHAPGSAPILHHRHSRSVPVKHFHTIMSSTREQLARKLHGSKHDHLHKAVTSALHSAHVGGGLELDRRVYKGGGLWDEIGKKFGHASVLAGEIGLAAAPVVGLINPAAGAATAAVSGAAVGIGAAVNDAYGK